MHCKRGRKLDSMCLIVILKHCMNNVAYSEERLEFLRRFYSDELCSLNLELRIVAVDQLYLWLLSPYWKNVKLERLRKINVSMLQKVQIYGSAVTLLDMSCVDCSEEMLKSMVCSLPNVRHLNLSGTLCTNDIVTCIKKTCSVLITLNLNGCRRVDDTGMQILGNSEPSPSNLKYLNVSRTNVTIKGVVAVLNKMPCIEDLECDSLNAVLCELYKFYMGNNIPISIRYKLTKFRFTSYLGLDLQLLLNLWTRICPNVKSVVIASHMDDMHFQTLLKFKHLQELRFSFHMPANDSFMESLSDFLHVRGEMLTVLCIQNVPIAINVVVQCCKNLEELTLFNIEFKDFLLRGTKIETNKLNLRKLSYHMVDFSTSSTFKSFCYLMSSCRNIQRIFLTFCKNLKDDVVDMILNSANGLSEVGIGYADISLHSVLRIFQWETVNKIHLHNCMHVLYSKLPKNLKTSSNTCSWYIAKRQIKF